MSNKSLLIIWPCLSRNSLSNILVSIIWLGLSSKCSLKLSPPSLWLSSSTSPSSSSSWSPWVQPCHRQYLGQARVHFYQLAHLIMMIRIRFKIYKSLEIQINISYKISLLTKLLQRIRQLQLSLKWSIRIVW